MLKYKYLHICISLAILYGNVLNVVSDCFVSPFLIDFNTKLFYY